MDHPALHWKRKKSFRHILLQLLVFGGASLQPSPGVAHCAAELMHRTKAGVAGIKNTHMNAQQHTPRKGGGHLGAQPPAAPPRPRRPRPARRPTPWRGTADTPHGGRRCLPPAGPTAGPTSPGGVGTRVLWVPRILVWCVFHPRHGPAANQFPQPSQSQLGDPRNHCRIDSPPGWARDFGPNHCGCSCPGQQNIADVLFCLTFSGSLFSKKMTGERMGRGEGNTLGVIWRGGGMRAAGSIEQENPPPQKNSVPVELMSEKICAKPECKGVRRIFGCCGGGDRAQNQSC